MQSEEEGLAFHHVPDFAGGSCQVCVPWGTVIHGTLLGNDWLQVGDYFLPMHLNGAMVLRRERRCLPKGASSHVAAASPQGSGNTRARSSTFAMPPQHGNVSGSVGSVRGSSVTMAAPLSSGPSTRVGSGSVVVRPRVQSAPTAVGGHGGHGNTVYCAPRLSLRQCVRPLPPRMIPTPARAVVSSMVQRGVSYSGLPEAAWMAKASTVPYAVANPAVAIETSP